MRPDPSDPFQATADEADLTAELAAMAGPAAEALLGQLASAVFGSGGADLAHVTWSDDGEADAGPGGLLTSPVVGAGEARMRNANGSRIPSSGTAGCTPPTARFGSRNSRADARRAARSGPSVVSSRATVA